MATTNIPPIQFTTTGIVLPTDAEILAGAQADIDAAFGGGVNQAFNTPQGQLASSESAIVADKNSEIAYILNQIDPRYAMGRFQDAIGQIYFMTRKSATSTVVICTIGGVPGTYIPAGALALDTSQNVYQLLGAVNIGAGGTVSAEFANLATGPIACAAGTLTQIYQAIPGWDTITNPADGIPGTDVESPQAFELRRQNSVAANSHGTPDAIFAAVYAVSGVLDCFVIDNPSGNTVNYGSTNYPLAPHSIFVAVVGGTAADIAQAIWQYKDAGCNYNTAAGNGTVQTVTVYDTRYSAPQPAYSVSFLVPGNTAIYFAVNLATATGLPSNYVTLVQNAIIAQFNGTNGATPESINSLILASAYYYAVQSAISGIQIASIYVGLAASPTGTQQQMGIDQVPTITAADITVTVI